MVGVGGIEPPTPKLSASCSNHLSYTPMYLEAALRVARRFTAYEAVQTTGPSLPQQISNSGTW